MTMGFGCRVLSGRTLSRRARFTRTLACCAIALPLSHICAYLAHMSLPLLSLLFYIALTSLLLRCSFSAYLFLRSSYLHISYLFINLLLPLSSSALYFFALSYYMYYPSSLHACTSFIFRAPSYILFLNVILNMLKIRAA